MTCIAAVVHKRKIYMACDSGVSCGSEISIMGNSKIVTLEIPAGRNIERIMIGGSGDLRIINLISIFKPPKRTKPVEEYLIGDFSKAFSEHLDEYDAKREYNNAVNVGFYTLIGFKGHIYSWSVDFGLIECVEDFEVEGSGSTARGVLWALKDNNRMTPEEKLFKTMEYAATYCEGVRGPFRMFVLE